MGHTRMMGITRVMSVREMMAALTSAYPVDGPNGYHCPLAYPKKLITLQFETVYATYDYPRHDGLVWALANGDTSGVSELRSN
jgi:hypothetical protein